MESSRKHNAFRISVATGALALLCSSWSHAQEVARFPIVDAPPQTPGLGPGLRIGSDNYIGENTRTDLIPLYLYEGKLVYAHGTELGLHIVNNEHVVLNVFARARFNRLDPGSNEELAGLRSRHQSADAGASFTVKGRLGHLELAGFTDVLGKSNGSEANLTYRYPVRRNNWSFSPFFTLSYQDAKLTRYYYGVSEAEATPERPAYEPGQALNVIYGVNTAYHFTDKVFAFGNIMFEGLDSSIANSPIVRANNEATAFVGATYLFGDQKKFTGATEPKYSDGQKHWSYRVHWAYQVFHNIFPLPMAGYWEKSERTPDLTPTQAGLTISRLVQPGDRVDFYARLGFYRHFEEPAQKDYWSYNAYMSAMFKSYSKRTGRVNFRWGLSFGMSYADSIPSEEIQKFDNRGKNSSHLLNYLEWQVDVPLDNLIKTDWARGFYIGAVVKHRYGIFGTSDLLVNVEVGSDCGGFHLECMKGEPL